MDYIYYIFKNLSLIDYSLIAFLLFLNSFGNYLNACNFGKLRESNDKKEKTKIININFFISLILLYIVGVFISHLVNSVVVLLIIFGVSPLSLYFIFLKKYHSSTLSKGLPIFLQNTIYSLPGALLSITYYLLIIALIFPKDKALGISLLLVYLIPRTLSLVIQPNFNLFQRGKKFIINSSLRFLLSLIASLGTILIIIFSFSFSIQYKSDFEKRIINDQSISSIKNNIEEFNKSIQDLSISLSDLIHAQAMAQSKLDSVQIFFKYINRDIENMAIKKVKLEDKVKLLQNKSESEIKKDAIYIALSEMLNRNQYATIILSLIIGIITGFIANFLFKKANISD